MAQETFAQALRAERDRASLSLRRLAETAGVNPGYVSRLEAAQITPQLPNVLQLADALAEAASDRAPATRERIRTRLATAAGHIPSGKGAIADLKDRFEALLKERGLDVRQIAVALDSVSMATMRSVLNGDERLEIARPGEPGGATVASLPGEEIVVLPPTEHQFPAGPHASITVRLPLTRQQRQQVTLIAQLLRSILSSN